MSHFFFLLTKMYLVRFRTQSIRLKLGVKLKQRSVFRLKTTVSVSSSSFCLKKKSLIYLVAKVTRYCADCHKIVTNVHEDKLTFVLYYFSVC